MPKKLSLLTVFCSLFILSYAQNLPNQTQGKPANQNLTGSVHGHVTDNATGNPVEYANIALFKAKDSSMVNGSITDVKGKFTIDKVPFGLYYARLSFMGYGMKTISDIKVFQRSPLADLGNIELEAVASALNEVTITGERKAVEFHLDKKVVNVEKNLSTLGGTAVDVLQNIPSVTVDIDGNVSLRGNSNITLLIDGRPSGISGTRLEQIPASSIETVELITNPSARYNPEGMSGIINIRLRKKREVGFNGIVSANVGTGDKYNGSVNLNYRVNDFNFFGSLDGRSDWRKGWGESERTTFTDGTNTVIDNINEESDNGRRNRQSGGLKLGLDYTPNPMNSYTLSWFNSQGKSKDRDFSESFEYLPPAIPDAFYTSAEIEKGNDNSNDFTFSYRRGFQRKGEELTLDAVYNLDDEIEQGGQDDHYTMLEGFTLDSTYRRNTETKTRHNNLNVQLNFVYPFGKDSRLEGGYQGILRGTDDDYFVTTFKEGNVWVNDTNLSNHFLYDENIHAVYGIIGQTFNKLSYQFGLRFEMASTHADQKTSGTTFDKSYNSFYPSLHVSYKLPKEQEVQLSYSRRVNRPNMWSLNPFVDYSTPNMIRYGNPDLKPEYINSYELGYAKYWKNSSANASLFYRKINDVIKRYMFVDTSGIYHMTSLNLTSGISYGTELVWDQSILKWWKVNLNFSYFKTEIKGDESTSALSNSNYSWTSRLGSTMTFPGKLSVQLTGNYRGPMVNPQGTMKEVFFAEIAMKKDFLKEKLSLSFRLSDIFKTMSFGNTSSGEGFDASMERHRESRVAYLGISYKFGKNGVKQKARKKTEQNNGGGYDEGDF